MACSRLVKEFHGSHPFQEAEFRYRRMAAPSLTSPKPNDRLAQLWADLLADPVPPQPAAPRQGPAGMTVPLQQGQALRRNWRVDLRILFHSLLEPEVFEPPLSSAGDEAFEGATFSERSPDVAVTSPFHWEPKAAWIARPGHFTPAFLNPADPRRFIPRPKIPLRPLHKQPFYRRFFFYLSRWLNRRR